MALVDQRRPMRASFAGITVVANPAMPEGGFAFVRPEPREQVTLDNTTRLFLADVEDFLADLCKELGDTVPRHVTDKIGWYGDRVADVLRRA